MIIVSDAVIAAARRRKIRVTTIAGALGVSHQRVDQRLRRFERSTGEKVENPRLRQHNGRVAYQCSYCQKWIWATLAQIELRKRRYSALFCSRRCYSTSQRLLLEKELPRIIEMRQSGQSWKSLAAIYGINFQAIQHRLWRHLDENGMLTVNIVNAIWRVGFHDRGRPAAWNHLANSTGIIPMRGRFA